MFTTTASSPVPAGLESRLSLEARGGACPTRATDPLATLASSCGGNVGALRAASSVEALLAAPVGKYFAGESFLYFYPEQEFNGFLLWGRPSAADIGTLNRLMDAVLTPDGGQHLSFVDVSGLGGVDPDAFETMGAYLARRREAFRATIRRQAVIRPPGVTGAIVEGFYSIFPPAYPARVFSRHQAGLEWLGLPNAQAAEELLCSLRKMASACDPLVRELRGWLLASRCDRPGVERAAAALGLSERTLQRRLRDANTTFQRELQSVRLCHAQELMLSSEANLTTIALEAGFASLQHFSSAFRELTGATPSAWRARPTKAPARCEARELSQCTGIAAVV